PGETHEHDSGAELADRAAQQSRSPQWGQSTVEPRYALAREFLAAAQRALREPAQGQAWRFDRLGHDRLVAPDDARVLAHQTDEQIAILAGAEAVRGIERTRLAAQ